MLKREQIVTCHTDTAVSLKGVTKTFEQWRRTGKAKDMIRNLIKPNKSLIHALDDVSFEIKKGEFVAYAGPNGAGKSTTMKLLCGMLIPIAGEIRVLGLSPRSDRVELMKRMGVMFGNRTELWWDHPVIQSFEWKRVVWNIAKDRYGAILDMVVELLDIKDILHTFARELSLGQRMKADLAMMLLHEPELILLDEPTIGLDVLAKRQMITFLKELNQERNTTVVVTSHDMDDLEEMARRILLISKGKLGFDGGFDRLREQTGSVGRVVLTVSEGNPPALRSARLVSSENGVHEYEIHSTIRGNGGKPEDFQKSPIQAVLSEVATLNHVTDVEIKKAPMEEVITGLYKKWKT